MNEEFVTKFMKNKTNALDIIYENTSLTLGSHHTRLALKYILLNDPSALEGMEGIEDKYLYISSKGGSRALIKLFDEVDIYQILAKFSMQYFGLYINDFSKSDIITKIVKMSLKDHYETYMYLKLKKDVAIELFDLFVDIRYKKNKKHELDLFDGGKNKDFKHQYLSLDTCYNDIKKNT